MVVIELIPLKTNQIENSIYCVTSLRRSKEDSKEGQIRRKEKVFGTGGSSLTRRKKIPYCFVSSFHQSQWNHNSRITFQMQTKRHGIDIEDIFL